MGLIVIGIVTVVGIVAFVASRKRTGATAEAEPSDGSSAADYQQTRVENRTGTGRPGAVYGMGSYAGTRRERPAGYQAPYAPPARAGGSTALFAPKIAVTQSTGGSGFVAPKIAVTQQSTQRPRPLGWQPKG